MSNADSYRVELDVPVGPHFFGCWDSISPDICHSLLQFFEARQDLQSAGRVTGGIVNTKVKDSLDIRVEPADFEKEGYEVFGNYFTKLHECYQDYCTQWDFLNTFMDKVHIGTFNLQKYNPGGHFAEVHSERTSLTKLHRILVWMTYLNDIDEAGETEFVHYGLKVKPRAGRTLIWPAEWTHAHRGNPTVSETKYIITGWFNLAQ